MHDNILKPLLAQYTSVILLYEIKKNKNVASFYIKQVINF